VVNSESNSRSDKAYHRAVSGGQYAVCSRPWTVLSGRWRDFSWLFVWFRGLCPTLPKRQSAK